MARQQGSRGGTEALGHGPTAAADKSESALIGWLAGLAVGVVIGLGAALAARPGRNAKPAGDAASAANSPLELRPRDWKRILVRTFREFNDDQIPAVAAGVTLFALLSVFPALSAFASLYGLVADVEDVRRQIASLAGLLPGGALTVIGDQLTRLANADHGRLGVAFLISLLLSLWASNAGTKALIAGLNVAYEQRERRNFIRLNLVSLGFTAGAVTFVVLAAAALAVVPDRWAILRAPALAWLPVLRWPALLLVVAGLLSLLYRYGPCRPRARWRWITPGSALASVGWMLMSLLYSWYVANFGHYDRTYGSLGAVFGFMTWIWLSFIVVLFGAELNSEIESQSSAKTTGSR